MNNKAPIFGDTVCICRTPLTESLRLAGRRGVVYGETTPSVTGVDVIGGAERDYAIAVNFDGKSESIWFAPDLVEFVDHGAGQEMRVGSRQFVRDANGEWKPADGKKQRDQSMLSRFFRKIRR